MDMSAHDIPVRSARDRLIDLLRIGDTYPLTDLNVVADQLKVPFGGSAKIPIENAQFNVTYELCDPKGQPLGNAFRADGAGVTLVIETPRVSEDVTYRVRATKKPFTGSPLPPQPPRFLDEPAPVKVGLDTSLVIEVADFRTPDLKTPVQAPLLDSAKPNPQPSDPRIVPFGATVNVRVNKSQEGVQYSLMLDGVDVGGAVTGDLGALTLPTGRLEEDTLVQVRATKTFLPGENRSAETRPLDARLYVKVMANPALGVSIDASPIVDYGGDSTIRVTGTQRSATYRAYVRTISDRDFVHGQASAAVVTVPVAGKASAQVLTPPPTETWRTPDGYAAVGDSPVPGTGGDLTFTLKTLADDAIVVVQAIKDHQVDAGKPGSPTIASSIRLDQAVVALVRPDPARALTLRVPIAGAQTDVTMQVSNGQPGVFYFFRQAPAGAELPLAAYFHKHDDENATSNKGLGQLAVTVDLAIARDRAAKADRTDPARLFPPDPVLTIPPLATGSSLSARAMKAQTAVEAPMTQTAEIAAVPDIRADKAVVDAGGVVTIAIAASKPEEQYALTLNGNTVRPAVAGSGGTLSFTSDPLIADAVFEVVVTRPADKGMRVERVVQLPVTVRTSP